MSAINLGGGNSKKILEQVHKHSNMEVLNELSDSEGKLFYKDKEIITNSTGSIILASQVIETTDRKFVNKTEKDSLSGIKGNIQAQIENLKMIAIESMKYKGRYNDYAEMIANNATPADGDTVFIDNDETQSG